MVHRAFRTDMSSPCEIGCVAVDPITMPRSGAWNRLRGVFMSRNAAGSGLWDNLYILSILIVFWLDTSSLTGYRAFCPI